MDLVNGIVQILKKRAIGQELCPSYYFVYPNDCVITEQGLSYYWASTYFIVQHKIDATDTKGADKNSIIRKKTRP